MKNYKQSKREIIDLLTLQLIRYFIINRNINELAYNNACSIITNEEMQKIFDNEKYSSKYSIPEDFEINPVIFAYANIYIERVGLMKDYLDVFCFNKENEWLKKITEDPLKVISDFCHSCIFKDTQIPKDMKLISEGKSDEVTILSGMERFSKEFNNLTNENEIDECIKPKTIEI